MKDRETRRLEHSKQRSLGVVETAPDKNEMPENVPQIRYIPGHGLYSCVKFKGKIYYSKFDTSL